MLNSISWSEYFITITVLACAYYVIIFIKYFKWEVLKIFGITKVTNPGQHYFSPGMKENEITNPVENTDSAVAEMCISEIEAFSAQFEFQDNNKLEFIHAMKMLAAKYQLEDRTENDNKIGEIISQKIEHHFPDESDYSPVHPAT